MFIILYRSGPIVMRQLLTQCFRGYAAIGAVIAGFTALWALGFIDMSMSIVGYAWVVLGVLLLFPDVRLYTGARSPSEEYYASTDD